jgi:hypothetical protein
MDCYRHPGTASTATCVACAQPICQECREDVAGHPMCHSCVAAASARLGDAPAANPEAGVEPGPTTWLTSAPTAPGVSSPPAPTHVQAPKEFGAAPGLVRRVGRGLLWGAVYGQWWTLMTIASALFFGAIHGEISFDLRTVGVIVSLLIEYGFAGSVAGLIIGAANASFGTGAAIGVGVGLLLCLLEALGEHSFGGALNIFFYFFTGRFVGAGITWRVQQPVRGKPGAYGG